VLDSVIKCCSKCFVTKYKYHRYKYQKYKYIKLEYKYCVQSTGTSATTQ